MRIWSAFDVHLTGIWRLIWFTFDGHLTGIWFDPAGKRALPQMPVKCGSNPNQMRIKYAILNAHQMQIKPQSNGDLIRIWCAFERGIWFAFDLVVLAVFDVAFTRTATNDVHGAQPFSCSSVSPSCTITRAQPNKQLQSCYESWGARPENCCPSSRIQRISP